MEAWLKERELGNLVETFQKQDISLDDFPQLNALTLKIMKIPTESAKKFVKEWQIYNTKENKRDFKRDFSNLSFYPIQKHDLLELFNLQRDVLWTPSEVKSDKDKSHIDDLDENTYNLIEFELCFFSQMDGLINENLIENFKKETSFYKEAKYFYTIQEYIELVHNQTYSDLIETFIRDPIKKEEAFNAIQNYSSIRNIANLVEKWMDSTRPLMERIIAFACVEGILFQSAFAAIYWIKKRNILPALCLANEWIARDEGLHTRFAVRLYQNIVIDGIHPAVSKERIHSIVGEFVEAAEVFNKDALKADLIGLSLKDLMSYVKCTADVIIGGFGGEKLYNVENRLGDLMAVISLPSKSNFFEKPVTEYGKDSKANYAFAFTDDY